MSQRRSKEEAKAEIVAIATRLFGEKGYAKTSFQMIATEMGISQPAIVYHFKTKQVLFQAVVHAVILDHDKRMQASFAPSDNALDRLMKHFQVHYASVVQEPFFVQIITALYYFGTFEPVFQDFYTLVKEKAREKIELYFYQGRREGLIKQDNPSFAAAMLHDFLLGSLVNIAASNAGLDAYYQAERKWRALLQYTAQHNEAAYLP